MLLVVLALLVTVARMDGLASAMKMKPGALAQQRPSAGSVWRSYRNVLDMKTDDNDIELVWSDPVLVEDFAYRLPVPDHFYVFDDKRHMFGARWLASFSIADSLSLLRSQPFVRRCGVQRVLDVLVSGRQAVAAHDIAEQCPARAQRLDCCAATFSQNFGWWHIST